MNIELSKNDRYLIINADDLGMCHSSNQAIFKLFEEGFITSSTMMAPCPWVKEVEDFYKVRPEVDIGIHLTFTSEWKLYKWGPVTKNSSVSSLITKEGYFPETSEEVELHAKREEVREEIKNQIELVINLGINPSHLDNHMGSLYGLKYGNSFLDIVFEFCKMYNFPFRLPKNLDETMKTQLPKEAISNYERIIDLADKIGVRLIDYLVSYSFSLEDGEDYKAFKKKVIDIVRNLKAGISELYIHPGLATEELKAINPHWEKRQMEFDLFRDEELYKIIQDEGIKLIRWKDLRD
ncbi:MAG: polysaccharide deacetylase family protein [bacterium]|nr:polysaccharide deacetylase family protein [bacterium]